MKHFFTLVTFIFFIISAGGKAPSTNVPGNAKRNAINQNKSIQQADNPVVFTPPIIGTGTGLNGAYYNHTSVAGFPVFTRIDSTIDFEFTYSKQPVILSPVPGVIPEDYYSVRWEGKVEAQYTETYTFYTLSDDGIRLWVNGVQLIDNWINQGPTEKTGTIALTAGQQYSIVIEYYENTGESVSKLFWSGASTPKQIIPKSQLYPPDAITGNGTGLQGNYFNGINGAAGGDAVLSRIDSTINMECTYTHFPLSPAPGIVPDDHFSVSWQGEIQPQFTETYTFYTQSDDGIRLSVAGSTLIDNWTNQGVTEKSATITLVAGNRYWIFIDYYENTGDAVAKLYWSSASTAKQLIPKSQLYPNFTSTRIANTAPVAQQPLAPENKTFTANIFANPVKTGQMASLQINSGKETPAALSIFSSNGNLINTKRINLAKGTNAARVSTSGWAPGLYLINIDNGEKPITLKLLIQ